MRAIRACAPRESNVHSHALAGPSDRADELQSQWNGEARDKMRLWQDARALFPDRRTLLAVGEVQGVPGNNRAAA